MTTTTLESVATTPESVWSYGLCKLWLSKHHWTMSSMEYLMGQMTEEEDDFIDELASEILLELASDFWEHTPGIQPNAKTLVSMVQEFNFDDDCMFYADGIEWLLGTNKRFQSKFLWTFWSCDNPCELNSMVASLMDSEDLYIRCLAAMVRAYEQIRSGYLKNEGGVEVLIAAYEALTNKEFIIRLKQARMLSPHVAMTIRTIESEIREWADFTVEQKDFLSKFLREQGI